MMPDLDREYTPADLDTLPLEELESLFSASYFDVDCTGGCGEGGRVEPDGDYECPNGCGGRLRSPLVSMGVI